MTPFSNGCELDILNPNRDLDLQIWVWAENKMLIIFK